MSTYRLIIGLPGSGKTHRLRQLEAEGWRCFDDISLDKINLKERLQPQFENEQIAIADPFLCQEESVKSLLRLLPQDALIEYEYFENNPIAALANRSQEERRTEKFVWALSKKYNPINPKKI